MRRCLQPEAVVPSQVMTTTSRQGEPSEAAGSLGTVRVLVVDDDEAIRTVVRWQLDAEGFQSLDCGDGRIALQLLADHDLDLMILDLGLPGESGLDVLRAVRRGAAGPPGLPVIVLSGRGGETERIIGLDLGADDYLVKPFSPGELAARVRSLLRRSNGFGRSPVLRVGALSVETASRTVQVNGEPVEFTAKEFDLLRFLAQHPRQVFNRAQLLDRVWHCSDGWLGEATVTEHVHRIRAKLERSGQPRLVRTVRGVGYMLADGS